MGASDWTVAQPEDFDLRSQPFQDLVAWLDGFDQANIHGIVVIRRSRLVFEHYRTGPDECWECRSEK
jgi:hypothetical protein